MLNEVRLIGILKKQGTEKSILQTSERFRRGGKKVEVYTPHELRILGKLAKVWQEHIEEGYLLHISGKIAIEAETKTIYIQVLDFKILRYGS